MTAPTPAPTRTNSSVVTAILLSVVVLVGGLSAWLLAGPNYDLTTARGTAEAFADAMNSGDQTLVASLSCSDNSAQRVAGSLGPARLSVVAVTEEESSATATFEVTFGPQSQQMRAGMERDFSSGRWTICARGGGGF